MVSHLSNHVSELTQHSPLETGDVHEAAALLHQFNAVSLGEGNVMAGGNTLAAMALTLANIAPPGSCLVDRDDGSRVPVGMNVMVSGGLSCGLVSDRVLAPLRSVQDNLFAHIRQQVERRKNGEKRTSETSMFLGKEKDPTPPTVLDRLEKDDHFNEKHFEAELRTLLCPPANAGVSEITETPVFFAGIGSKEGLNTATGFANRGRLLAHVTLSGKDDVALLDKVCDEVVSGCPVRGLLAASVRGEVIATDPAGALDDLLQSRSGNGWLQRLLWLVDHTAGPEMDITGDSKRGSQLTRVGGLFGAALEEMAARRLNFHKHQPMSLEYPFARKQTEWNAFLARLEPRFPGITGTLRPLWASLLFGLSRILEAAPAEEQPRFTHGQVDAFARLLALRMVNAREVIFNEQQHKRLTQIATSIRLKLREGPQTVRDIMRRSNNLDADTCREALARLADGGQVEWTGRQWQLVATSRTRTLTLDA